MKNLLYFLGIGLIAILFVECKSESSGESAQQSEVPAAKVTIDKQSYGTTADGQQVDLYTLKNSKGMAINVITYGGIITSWTAPNKEGIYEDIVLGYDSLSQYTASNPYFGALIGRYGNRIAKGMFTIDGNEYQLATNDGANHLQIFWEVMSRTRR